MIEVINQETSLKKAVDNYERRFKEFDRRIEKTKEKHQPKARKKALNIGLSISAAISLTALFTGGLSIIVSILLFPILLALTQGLVQHYIFSKETEELRLKRSILEESYDPIKKGYEGELTVTKVLSELKGNYLLINDVTIPKQNKKGVKDTQIDHVLLTPSGKVVCIETKNIKGKYYPHGRNWLWYPTDNYIKGKKKHQMFSPQLQSEYHARALRENFEKYGLPYEVDAIVVMVHPEGEYMGEDRECPVVPVCILNNFIREKYGTKKELECSEAMQSQLKDKILEFGELSKGGFIKVEELKQ